MDTQTRTQKVVIAILVLLSAFGIISYDAYEPPVSLSGTALETATAVEDVVTAQEEYFQKTGSYLQVKADGTTVDGKIAKDELKIDVVDYEIHTYVQPNGEKGFFLITNTPDGKAIIDYGDGGFSYTPKPPVILPPSTTTDEVNP